MNNVPSVAIAHRPAQEMAQEMAILVDPSRAKALGDQLSDNPLNFVVDIPRYLSLTGKISVDSSLFRAGRCTI